MDYDEELEDLPEEWITLLQSMPEIKEEFVKDKMSNEDEMISPYFFSYFQEDYMLCKPFFSCFERGEEALYNVTLDYNIVHYILWPLGKKDDIENPYAGYIKLWENDIQVYVIDDNLVKYVK